jgi:septin family protein
MEILETIKSQKVALKYYCKKCDYKCSRYYDYDKHLSTRKHNMETVGNEGNGNTTMFECLCGKIFRTNSGLWKHKNKCSQPVNPTPTTLSTPVEKNEFHLDKELLIKMLLKNQEVMEKMMEMMPQMGNNSHNTKCI